MFRVPKNNCHGPRRRATQLTLVRRFTQRADARWLGGPAKPGHDTFVMGEQQ
jgi:hypothetical protein